MSSSPITSWEIDGQTVADFIFLSSKITADGDCSHEIKRWWPLGRQVMTNLDNILKSRDITLPAKVCLVKDLVFPLVTYGCESWTIKKAEHRRIESFELWCWRRLFKSPLDCKEIQLVNLEGNQPSIFTGRTDAEAETPILWPHDGKNWLIGKDPNAGKDWRREEKGMTEDEMVGWHHWLDEHDVWGTSRSWERTGKPGMLQSMGSQSRTRLSDWTQSSRIVVCTCVCMSIPIS